jgi:hypothetical protein
MAHKRKLQMTLKRAKRIKSNGDPYSGEVSLDSRKILQTATNTRTHTDECAKEHTEDSVDAESQRHTEDHSEDELGPSEGYKDDDDNYESGDDDSDDDSGENCAEHSNKDDEEQLAKKLDKRKGCPCPNAIEFNCLKTFSRPGRAKMHAIIYHRGKYPEEYAVLPQEKTYTRKRCPCPDALVFSCLKTFSRPGMAKRHVITCHKEKHSEEYAEILANSAEERKREKKRFPCPRAVEFNCPKTFASRGGAKVQVNKFHNSHIPCSCPIAVRFRCSKAFSSPELAKKHIESKHGGETFPCPGAKQPVCPRLFTTRHEARLHVKIYVSSQTKYVNGLKIAT